MGIGDEIQESLKPEGKIEKEGLKKNNSLFSNMKHKFSSFSVVSKVLYASEAIRNKLHIPKLGDDKTYSSSALAQFWLIFKTIFKRNEEIAKVYLYKKKKEY